ncbi:MAG: tetratricopeptide repeat protein [Pirellulales bacterium]
MRSKILHAFPLALASGVLLSGCVTRPATSPTSSSAISPTPAETADASPWDKIKASFASNSKKMSNAATPTERRIKARDPIALATPAKNVGSDLYVAVARIHETKGDYAAAATQYERALAVDGNDLAALIGYGHLLDRQRKFTEATLYYERATKAHPDSAAAWNDLGLCYSRRADKDRAMIDRSIAALGRAVELHPEKKLYRNNIAAVLVEVGRDREAATHLLAVHDPATAHYNLGYLANQQGRVDAARQYFTEALRLNPQLTAARGFLEQLDRQTSAVAERQPPPQYAPRVLHVPTGHEPSVLAPGAGASLAPPAALNRGAATRRAVREDGGRSDVQTAAVVLPLGDLTPRDVAPAAYEAPADESFDSQVEPAVYEDAPEPDDSFGEAPLPE